MPLLAVPIRATYGRPGTPDVGKVVFTPVTVHAVDPATGTVLTRRPLVAPLDPTGTLPPLALDGSADGLVYKVAELFVGDTGRPTYYLRVLDTDAARGIDLWTLPVGELIHPTPGSPLVTRAQYQQLEDRFDVLLQVLAAAGLPVGLPPDPFPPPDVDPFPNPDPTPDPDGAPDPDPGPDPAPEPDPAPDPAPDPTDPLPDPTGPATAGHLGPYLEATL